MLLFWFGLVTGVAGASLTILTIVISLAYRKNGIVSKRQEEMHAETIDLLKTANAHRATISMYLYETAQHSRQGE